MILGNKANLLDCFNHLKPLALFTWEWFLFFFFKMSFKTSALYTAIKHQDVPAHLLTGALFSSCGLLSERKSSGMTTPSTLKHEAVPCSWF